MTWLVFALVAPMFWAASNFVDKHVLGEHTRGIFDFLFLSAILSGVAVPILMLFFGFPELSWESFLPLATGAILLYSYGFYGNGIEEGETSRLVILFELVPVLTLAFGYILFGQSISWTEFFAFALMLVGATIVAIESTVGKIEWAKGARWVFIAVLFWAVMFLIADFALTKISYGSYIVLDTFGYFLAGIPLLAFAVSRKQIIDGFRTGVSTKYGWFSVNEVFDLLGQMSIKKAIALAPAVGLVNVVMQVQSFYSVALGLVLTLLIPRYIREDISFRHIGQKLLGALVMVVGIALLFVN